MIIVAVCVKTGKGPIETKGGLYQQEQCAYCPKYDVKPLAAPEE